MPSKPSAKHEQFVRNTAPERNEQAPLGPQPTYDDVLDVAVDYTFPASDPLAVDTAAKDAQERDARPQDAGPGPPAERDRPG